MTDKRAEYAAKNPLGGPATVFERIAGRLRAGEEYHEVLADYGLRHDKPQPEIAANAVEPVLTGEMRVGAGTFHRGVKLSTVQLCIDRHINVYLPRLTEEQRKAALAAFCGNEAPEAEIPPFAFDEGGIAEQNRRAALPANAAPSSPSEKVQSETPRTDALLLEINEGRVYKENGSVANLARQLERELAEAKRQLAERTTVAADRYVELQSLRSATTANGDMENMRVTLGCCVALMLQSGNPGCLELAQRIPMTMKNGEPYALVGLDGRGATEWKGG